MSQHVSHRRSDEIHELRAEIEELRAEIERLRTLVNSQDRLIGEDTLELARLRLELERLRPPATKQLTTASAFLELWSPGLDPGIVARTDGETPLKSPSQP